MAADKGGKGGGFFHLFDWNMKSRKKLFVNGSVSPEGTKQACKSDDILLASCVRLSDTDDDDIRAVSSVKASSDYSCASSVTDEGYGNGTRAPGVVARLMGLDSLPTTSGSYSSPLFEPRSLQDDQYPEKNPEFEVNSQFINDSYEIELYSQKPPELKCQKMPSSPIERFQTEVFPPKTARSLPISHYKLLSPIKNARFISADNAAHIMEAAVKILEPGMQGNSSNKIRSVGSPSLHESQERAVPSQGPTKLLGSLRKLPESNAAKYLRGQPLNKSWSGSESDPSCKGSLDCRDANSLRAKGKGKSVSLAVQAKTNVQKRESVSTSRSSLIQVENGDIKLNQPFKNLPNVSRNKLQKKASSSSAILKQNNQKQNCLMNKDTSSAKPSVSYQEGRKLVPADTASLRSKTSTASNLAGRSKYQSSREGLQMGNNEKNLSSSREMRYPRKKRLTEEGCRSEKNKLPGTILVRKHEKHIQPNVIIDEHLKQGENSRKKCMDVVSFTFTSPIVKHMPVSLSSTKLMKNQDPRDCSVVDACESRKSESFMNKMSSTEGLNVITGDALSILLEQKLKELTLGLESSHSDEVKVTTEASSTSGEPIPASENSAATEAVECLEEFSFKVYKDNLDYFSDPGLSSVDHHLLQLSHIQEPESFNECSSSDSKGPEQQQPSPFCVLEACFSNGSSESSGSCDSTNGNSTLCSSAQVQDGADFKLVAGIQSQEADIEISDSASSSFVGTMDGEDVDNTDRRNSTKIYEQEIDYVRDVLITAGLESEYSIYGYARKRLDPLDFDQLESKISHFKSDESKDGGLKRKLLFDCVNECLDLKRNQFAIVGFRSWTNGVEILRQRELSEDICKEISVWRSMGDWMVDELVDKDMSSRLGRWVEFETDGFETGLEIEGYILESLVNEMVAELTV